MNVTEIIARLIDSKAINGEEAMCLTNAMSPKLVYTEPYSPNYKCNYDFWWMNPLNRPSSAIANPKSTICEGIDSSASTISLNKTKEQIIIDGWVARDENGDYQFMSTFQQMAQKAFIAGANWQASNTIITDNSLVIDNLEKEIERLNLLLNKANEFGLHGNPYSPIYPCPEVGNVITTANGTFNTTASSTTIEEKEITIDGWVARDKDGVIYVYSVKPGKERIKWLSSDFINIERHSFPEVKWEDEEPTKVKLIIEKV